MQFMAGGTVKHFSVGSQSQTLANDQARMTSRKRNKSESQAERAQRNLHPPREKIFTANRL